MLWDLEDDAWMKRIIKWKLANNKVNILNVPKILEVWKWKMYDSDEDKQRNLIKFVRRRKRSVDYRPAANPERNNEYIVYGALPKLEINFFKNNLVDDDSSFHESLVPSSVRSFWHSDLHFEQLKFQEGCFSSDPDHDIYAAQE